MGTNESKYVQKPVENSVEETGSIPSTPILTSKVSHEDLKSQDENLDPRSPSRHIARTPIEILSAAAHKLSALTIETTELDRPAVETPLKRHLILGIDPRSPTIGLQRTPIVISPVPDSTFPGVIRNKNLEKVKNVDKLRSPTFNSSTSPKLLSSNPITPKKVVKNDTYKRKSFVFLETNVDYTETDLDVVIQEKYAGKHLSSENSDDSCLNTSLNSQENEASRESSLVMTPQKDQRQLLDVSSETDSGLNQQAPLLEPKEQNDTDDKNESKILADTEVAESGIKEHEVVIEAVKVNEAYHSSPNANTEDNKHTEETEASVGSDFVDDQAHPEPQTEVLAFAALLPQSKSAPVSPPNVANNVTPKQSKSEPVTPPMVNLTADVRELDKKLTNLIYEDEDPVICPRAVKPLNNQCRTPLGNKNDGDSNRRLPAQKLKVSDKPRKSSNGGSKIPVFKEKKIKVQSENIPPKAMRYERSKKPHWDPKDDTMVI